MSTLQRAREIGRRCAQEHFTKTAAGADVATPIAGALGTLPAALVGGLSSPEGRGFAGGAGAGGGAMLGQLGGALGGTALGAGGGYGVARLYNALQKDRSLWERLTGQRHLDPTETAQRGALLGALLGTTAGGAYGAYKGRRAGIGREGREQERMSREDKVTVKGAEATDSSDVLSAALGGLPLVGPAAAGLTSGMTGPAGLKATTGMATTGGSAVGQALGGLGGAALGAGLGAGGTALAKRLGADIDVDPRTAALYGALIGGGLGTVGGGVVGAAKGRAYGEERGERRELARQQIAEQLQRQSMQKQELQDLMHQARLQQLARYLQY